MRPLKLFRRTHDERPPLKDRLAALRARLGRVTRKPDGGTDTHRRILMAGSIAAALPLSALAAPVVRTLPAPGSAEAKAAFRAACHEDTLQAQPILEGYPELRRTPLSWWTTGDLGRALETGEITPTECAHLYPLASERELRLHTIEHRLSLGALHALAFADSYPVA